MQWSSSRSSIASIPKSRDVNELPGSNSLGCKRTPFIATSCRLIDPRSADPCPDLNARRAAPPGWGSVAALPLPGGPEAQCPDSNVEVQAPWPVSKRPPSPGPGTRNSCPEGWLHAGGKGSHPPDRSAGRTTAAGCHRHPPVLLQPGRPDPPVLPPQPAPLAQLDGHQQGLQRLQAGGLPLRHPGSSGGCHRRLPGLRPGRGQLAEPQVAGPGSRRSNALHSPGTGSFLAAGSVKEIRYDGKAEGQASRAWAASSWAASCPGASATRPASGGRTAGGTSA